MCLYATGDTILGFVAFHKIADGTQKTGLAPTVSVTLDTSATVVASGTASEVGSTGVYYFSVAGASVTVAGNYLFKFSITDATLMFRQLTACVQVSGRIGYLDAAISTRAAPSDIPNAAAIAADVQTGMTAQGYTAALAPNLANADAKASDILAQVDVKSSTLATPADVPTAVENAEELLDHDRTAHTLPDSVGEAINNADVATSTRATPAQVTAAVPTANTIAQTVWNWLTTAIVLPGSIGAWILAKLGQIGAGTVLVSSPVLEDGKLVKITSGDTYNAARGNALVFTDGSNTWPDLPAGTVVGVHIQTSGANLVHGGSILVGTGTGKSVQVELTSAQSAMLSAKVQTSYVFELKFEFVGGDVFTPIKGTWITDPFAV